MNRGILFIMLTGIVCLASSGNCVSPKDGLLEIEDSMLMNSVEQPINFNPPKNNEEFSPSWCDPQLGCLFITPNWFNPNERTINNEPWSRARIATTFSLHTRESVSLQEPFESWVYIAGRSLNTITRSTFNASRPTKILVHGFFNTGFEDIFQDIAANLLKHGDYNVIVTHWGPGAGNTLPFYPQAYSNSRVVGLEIAFLVNLILENFGGFAKDYHIIGHSLGGHIAGYAGERIENLGRITGLDPAGPAFAGLGPEVRLDPTDAQFVDVLHTNGGFLIDDLGNLGTLQPMGHLDFYPNGGTFQPGCDNIFSQAPCSHSRARELFRDALISKCKIVAYECSDITSFREGKCTSCGRDRTKCAPVGMNSVLYPSRSRNNVKLYYTTTGTSPYCQYHYVVEMTVAGSNSRGSVTTEGSLAISFRGTDNSWFSSRSGRSAPELRLPSGNRTKIADYFLTSLNDVGTIKQLSFLWTPSNCRSSVCNLRVKNVTISALNEYPQTNEPSNRYFGCQSPNKDYSTITPQVLFTFNVTSSSNNVCK